MEITNNVNRMHEILCGILEMEEEELQSFLSHIKRTKKKYLVCMDMGCGGTSTAYYNIELDMMVLVIWNFIDEKGERRSGRNHLPTISGYNEGDPVIGPEALLYGRAAENFKKIPTDNNLNKTVALRVQDFLGNEYVKNLKEVWSDYFKKVWEYNLSELRKVYPDCQQEEVLFAVAHPASRDWKERDILNNYKGLICERTGLVKEQVITISEAKAAMQYTRKLKDKIVNWWKGVLIIDLGASTIDIEYLSSKNPNPMEWAITMAGKEIDKLLAYYILSESFPEFAQRFPNIDDYLFDETFWKDDDAFETLTGVTRASFMYDIRCLKERICHRGKIPTVEEYFGREFAFVAEIPTGEIMVSNLVSLEELIQDTEFTFECQNASIARYLNKGEAPDGGQMVKGSWYSHLEGLLSFALKELEDRNCSVGDIIITGGSCQLVGVKKYIERGRDNSNVTEKKEPYMLNNPVDYERTVPFGSIYYISDTIKYIEEMENFPKKLQTALDKEFLVNKKLSKYIASSVSGMVEREVEEALKEWAKYDYFLEGDKCTMNYLFDKIGQKMRNISENVLRKKVQEGIDDFKKDKEKNLASVYTEVNEFLKHLSQGRYGHALNMQGVNIRISVGEIAGCVLNGLKKMSLGNLIESFWAILGAIVAVVQMLISGISKEEAKLSKAIREDVRDKFINSHENTIQGDIEKIVQGYIQDSYKENRFGLEEAIIGNIADDIKRALYLS